MADGREQKIKTVKVPMGASRDSVYEALNGVSVDWLRRAFHMTSVKCSAKLRGLRVKGVTVHGTPLYDLGEAAERLVKPKLDLQEYLKDIKVDDLPERLREPFWNAKLKQQRFEKNAGELWRTEAVISLFGSNLKDAKERIRLITTLAESNLGLNTKQIEGLREIVNNVQEEIYNKIMALESQTPASIAELNEDYENDDPDYDSPTRVERDDDYEY